MARMASGSAAHLSDYQRASLETLVKDLRTVFGPRLQAVVAYDAAAARNGHLRTLCLVDRVTFDDLGQSLSYAVGWRRLGLAVPLVLSRHEFERTLDIFPLEYGSIISNHLAVVGDDPFANVQVAEADRRRACEQQAKSHLIHLREGFLETHGDTRGIARLISSSSAAFRTLLEHLARLETDSPAATDDESLAGAIESRLGVSRGLILEVLSAEGGLGTIADPTALLARYIEASERIWRHVDGWRA
jgi:hypothetical protein